MWLVYAVAFLLSGGILLIQLLSGDDGHHDGLDHALGGDHGLDHHPHQGPALVSMRSATYGLFSFGLVGGCLQLLGLATPGTALAVSLASGVATALLVGLAFRSLADPTVSGEAGFHEAKGGRGRLIVACAPGQRGKVRVSLKGQSVDMLATTEEGSLPAGTDVVVLDVNDDVAHVARAWD